MNSMKENNTIDIIIPCKDREEGRIQKCIDCAISSLNGLSPNIVVVDYNSTTPPNVENCKLIRVDDLMWNKSHALNIGILSGNNPYIMTLDADILLSKEHGKLIKESLKEDNFIIDTNVRRVKEINGDYNKMIKKSKPWFKRDKAEDTAQLFNLANGGFQVYSRNFYKKIGGIMEGMGYFMGGMDNWVYYTARINKLKIVDISYPLLHLEHGNQKDDNMIRTKEDANLINEFRMYKKGYLNEIVRKGIKKNPESHFGREKPCFEFYGKFLSELIKRNDLIQETIRNHKMSLNYMYQEYTFQQKKPSILIGVPNNYETIYSFFVNNVFSLYLNTKNFYPETALNFSSSGDLANMRNNIVRFALGDNPQNKKFDYVVMLDSDELYPPTFIIDFIKNMEKNKISILTGIYVNKATKRACQYWKIPEDLKKLNDEENCVPLKPKNSTDLIEACGMGGVVINTRVFDDLKYPYFNWVYNDRELIMGEDIYFCNKVKETKKYGVYCDRSVLFKHHCPEFLGWDRKFLKPKDL